MALDADPLASEPAPVQVIAGRHDHTCSLDGAVEENQQFVSLVRDFLERRVTGALVIDS